MFVSDAAIKRPSNKEDHIKLENTTIAACIGSNRINLGRFLEEFIVAAQLFELLERGGNPQAGTLMGPFLNFRILAAKQGALSIYHFGCSLEALRRQVGEVSKSRNILTVGLKQALSLFNRYFPNANNTRHAVAHAGELWASPKVADEHRLKSDFISKNGTQIGAGGYQSQSLFEKTYSIGWIGTVFEVTMDQTTIDKLQEVRNIVEQTFNLS